MRFLIDADLPRSAADPIRERGHEAVDVRDIGLGSAADADIAKYAARHGLCLLTGDYDFADIRNYPPDKYDGIVVLFIPPSATAAYIRNLVGEFLAHTDIVTGLGGRLAIVEPGRIRLRQNPSQT